MSEKPKAGEWWEDFKSERVYCVGNDAAGRPVVQVVKGFFSTIGPAWTGRKIEGCTGFDWVEQDRSNAGLLEALVNLRDNMDRLNKRVEKLEQASIPYQTIGGVALR